jgi:hypothetical protein
VLRPFWKQKGAAAGVVQRKQAVGLSRVCPKEEECRVGQARPPGRLRPSGEGESGPVGDEGRWPRLGRNQRWAKVQEIKSFQILFGILILGKLWKFVQGDLVAILTWGFFLKSSTFSRNLRKMPNDMP